MFEQLVVSAGFWGFKDVRQCVVEGGKYLTEVRATAGSEALGFVQDAEEMFGKL